MAAFQLGKNSETECSEIPERETNSEREGGRPAPRAMAARESRISCLSGCCRKGTDLGYLLTIVYQWMILHAGAGRKWREKKRAFATLRGHIAGCGARVRTS